jgi:hypothetical protein
VPAADGAAPAGGLFGGFVAPQPGSSFGGFGAAAASKPKDEEEGGEGEGDAGGDENGQELFGGPEVAPVVQLSEVPKQNGEEEESSVFTGGCGVKEGGARQASHCIGVSHGQALIISPLFLRKKVQCVVRVKMRKGRNHAKCLKA